MMSLAKQARAVVGRRLFWIVLILCAVMALGIGQWGYTRWDDEWLRGQLVGRWSVGEGLVVDFNSDGTYEGPGFEKVWWVTEGVLHISDLNISSSFISCSLQEYDIKSIDRESKLLGVKVPTQRTIDLYLFQIPLGDLHMSERYEVEWERVKP